MSCLFHFFFAHSSPGCLWSSDSPSRYSSEIKKHGRNKKSEVEGNLHEKRHDTDGKKPSQSQESQRTCPKPSTSGRGRDKVNSKDNVKSFKDFNGGCFNKKFGFNCVSFNADSILNKRDELLILVEQQNPDIIAVQEIYPKNIDRTQVQASELNIKGYDFFQSKDPALGAGLYVKTSLKALEVQVGDESTSESVWVRVRLCGQDNLLIGSVYRSPNSSETNDRKIDKLLSAASESGNSHVLVLGDFNHKEIDWSNLTATCGSGHVSPSRAILG